MWRDILATEPDLFLMIGDNHYADFWPKDGKMVMLPAPNIERIQEAYRGLGSKPGFVDLRKRCLLMATWDDHDYGANDQGNEFYLRKESQREFIKFFGFPNDHPIGQQEGIYHSQTFGESGKRVQVIMLDTRYHRDQLERATNREQGGGGPYTGTKDSSKTVLGDAQWKWLEKQLKQTADVRIIASSIQVVADEHGWETWGNFPHERLRLYKLIEQTKANGVIIVSGDRHLIEISCDDQRGTPYPIWDFTSSGLTQNQEPVVEPNKYRIGPVKREQNFGQVQIEWRQPVENTRVHLEGTGAGGKALTRQTVFLGSLQTNDE